MAVRNPVLRLLVPPCATYIEEQTEDPRVGGRDQQVQLAELALVQQTRVLASHFFFRGRKARDCASKSVNARATDRHNGSTSRFSGSDAERMKCKEQEKKRESKAESRSVIQEM